MPVSVLQLRCYVRNLPKAISLSVATHKLLKALEDAIFK